MESPKDLAESLTSMANIIAPSEAESSDKEEFPVVYPISKLIRKTRKDVLVLDTDSEYEENLKIES